MSDKDKILKDAQADFMRHKWEMFADELLKSNRSPGVFLANPPVDFRTSLLPIFTTRLKILRAMAPGLRDLPRPAFDEIQALLDRVEAIVLDSVGPVLDD